ncbi:MAG: ArnT family glycosyltransferase [Verrucomicrobiia bacterium]
MRFLTLQWQLRFLIGIVGVSLLFLLPSLVSYHGDERFYTDAAVRMTQTGDYFTPYTARGAMRFEEPILTYWAVLAGYMVFGISFMTSRLPFLIAGCLVILFTYRMALALFEQTRIALLAALIMASNVQLLGFSTRSTPDVLLCLFGLVSLLGFARILFQKDRAWFNYALAWVGAGLAVQTSALPGVGVALYPLLFCLVFRRGQTRLRELFEWKAFVLGVMAAVFWFGLMIWQHKDSLADSFYYEHATGQVSHANLLTPVKNLQAGVLGVLGHFLPWSALLALAVLTSRRSAASFWREHRAKAWFLAGWGVFILVPSIFGRLNGMHLLVVAYPLLAVMVAALLVRAEQEDRFQLWQRRLFVACVVAFGVVGIALAASGAMAAPRIFAAGILLAAGAAAVWMLVRRGVHLGWAVGFAAFPLLGFSASEGFVRPTLAESPAPALTARLLPEREMRERVYALNLDPSYEAQMRVLSGGRLTVVPLSRDGLASFVVIEDPVIFGQKDEEAVAGIRGTVQQVGFASRTWRLRDIPELFNREQREAARLRQRIPFYLLFPEPGANAVAPSVPQ